MDVGGWPARVSAASCAATSAVSCGQLMPSAMLFAPFSLGGLAIGSKGSALGKMTTVPTSARTPMTTRRACGRRAVAIHRLADTGPGGRYRGQDPVRVVDLARYPDQDVH